MANVQHNCAACKCTINNIRRVRQERVELAMMSPGVEHQNIKNFILNTSKMHDSEVIQAFHQEAYPINREMAIHNGAAREIAISREKERRAGNLNADILQNVLDPLQSSGEASSSRRGGRGRGQGRGRGSRGRGGSILSGPSIVPIQ